MKLNDVMGSEKSVRDFIAGYRSGIRSSHDTYSDRISNAVKNESRLLLPRQRGYDVGVAVKILKDTARGKILRYGSDEARSDVESFNSAQSLLGKSGNLYTSHVIGKLFDEVLTGLAERERYQDAISLRESLIRGVENRATNGRPRHVRS